MRGVGAREVLALAGAIGLFVVVIVLSFKLVSGDEAGGPQPACGRPNWPGAEETVFSWSRGPRAQTTTSPTCPRAPSVTTAGRSMLIAAHFTNRRFVGPELGQLEHPLRRGA